MNKNHIIMILSVFTLVLGFQVWAQNTDVLSLQDVSEKVQVTQTQEILDNFPEQNQPPETTTKEVSAQEIPVSVSDTVTPPVNAGSEQEAPTGTIVDSGETVEPIIGTSDIVSQPVIVDQIAEPSETPHVIFANPRTGTEVINGQFVKKTEIHDLSPQAQDFVASILK